MQLHENMIERSIRYLSKLIVQSRNFDSGVLNFNQSHRPTNMKTIHSYVMVSCKQVHAKHTGYGGVDRVSSLEE